MKCSIIICLILGLTHTVFSRPHKYLHKHRHASFVRGTKKTKLYERPNGDGELEPQLTAGQEDKESKLHERELLSCTDAACMEEKGNKLEEYVLAKIKSNIAHSMKDEDRQKMPPLTAEERKNLKHTHAANSTAETTAVAAYNKNQKNEHTLAETEEATATPANSIENQSQNVHINKTLNAKEAMTNATTSKASTELQSRQENKKTSSSSSEKAAEKESPTSQSKEKNHSKYKKLVTEVSQSGNSFEKLQENNNNNANEDSNDTSFKDSDDNLENVTEASIFQEASKTKHIIDKLLANQRRKEIKPVNNSTKKDETKLRQEEQDIRDKVNNSTKKDKTEEQDTTNRLDKLAKAYDQSNGKEAASNKTKQDDNDGYDNKSIEQMNQVVKNARHSASPAATADAQTKSTCTDASCQLQVPDEKASETVKEKKEGRKNALIEKVVEEGAENKESNKKDDEDAKEETKTECTDEACTLKEPKEAGESIKEEDESKDLEDMIGHNEEDETKKLKDDPEGEEHEVQLEEAVASNLAAKSRKTEAAAEEERFHNSVHEGDKKLLPADDDTSTTTATEANNKDSNTQTKSECTDEACAGDAPETETADVSLKKDSAATTAAEKEEEKLLLHKEREQKQNDTTSSDSYVHSDEADVKSECTDSACTLTAPLKDNDVKEKKVSAKVSEGFKVVKGKKGNADADKKPEESSKTLTKPSEKEQSTEKNHDKKEESQTKSECTDAACAAAAENVKEEENKPAKEESKTTKQESETAKEKKNKANTTETEEEIKDKEFAESIKDKVDLYNKTAQQLHQMHQNLDGSKENGVEELANAKGKTVKFRDGNGISIAVTDENGGDTTTADAYGTPSNEEEDQLFTVHNDQESENTAAVAAALTNDSKQRSKQQQHFAAARKPKDSEYPTREDENNMKYDYDFGNNYIL